MEHLWAPWRMAYLKKHVDKSPCFLCAALARKKDRTTHILTRGKHCFAILNRFPYNIGHLMVAPLVHKAGIDSLNDDERIEMFTLAARTQQALTKAMKPHGFNVGINLGRVAGAGLLDHVHMHIVPRWDGDSNFMPITAETKVIPMSLSAAWSAISHYL